jgi:TfoX/Sxy family transcriptional regulator of competence genes
MGQLGRRQLGHAGWGVIEASRSAEDCTMPYDEEAAERVRHALDPRGAYIEKKMFGGIGFLLGGNMCCGVWKEFLILRVGPEAYDDALEQPATREFDITGRAMKGWVMVEPQGYEKAADLRRWLRNASQFAATLPIKSGK